MLTRVLRRTCAPLVAARRPLPVVATTTSSSFWQQQQQDSSSFWQTAAPVAVVGAALFLAGGGNEDGLSTRNKTNCEGAEEDKKKSGESTRTTTTTNRFWSSLFVSTSRTSKKEKQAPKDPVAAAAMLQAIVPPKDGTDPAEIPTDEPATKPQDDILADSECFVCKVHRQGPCRPAWIPLERCVQESSKQQQKKSRPSALASCQDEFYAAFETCWNKHDNLYKLVALDVHQRDHVRVLEIVHSGTPVDDNTWIQPGLPFQVDWRAWQEHVQQLGEGASWQDVLRQGTRWTSLDKSVPFWKRFEMFDKTPVLVDVSAQVPTKHKGGNLMAAYAVDQDNMVLGYHDYSDASGQAQGAKTSSGDPIPFKISLLPGMTETIRIRALYTSTKYNNKGEKKEISQLYQGKPASLQEFL